MNKYLIFYSPKSTPGPVGYFILKLYYEDNKKFEGFDYYQNEFNRSMYHVVSKTHKHYLFEAETDDDALLIFETMKEELVV